MYKEESTVLYNGTGFRGLGQIQSCLKELPATSHRIDSYDCHPVPGGSLASRRLRFCQQRLIDFLLFPVCSEARYPADKRCWNGQIRSYSYSACIFGDVHLGPRFLSRGGPVQVLYSLGYILCLSSLVVFFPLLSLTLLSFGATHL